MKVFEKERRSLAVELIVLILVTILCSSYVINFL